MKTNKRAQALLQSTGYSAETHPVITALVVFACQNPGLEPANYGFDRAGQAALRSEASDITADFGRFKAALSEAASEHVGDQDVIAEAPHAFSGRMEWKDDPDVPAFGRVGHWHYTSGQYFPTEYRKAAATLLEYATRRVRGNRPPIVRTPRTIAELKDLNEENGGCWFGKSETRFFGTRIESGILPGNRFVTSEANEDGPRKFTVRSFDEKGSVDTVGEFHCYDTRREALAAARNLNQTVTA